MYSEVRHYKVKFTGHDLILPEWNLDVKEGIIQRVVLFVLLCLQIKGLSDTIAFSLVHQVVLWVQDMLVGVFNNACLHGVMVGPRVLGTCRESLL